MLGFFTTNGKKGKESKTLERQRESVCVAEHLSKRKIASAIKPRVRENKHVMKICD